MFNTVMKTVLLLASLLFVFHLPVRSQNNTVDSLDATNLSLKELMKNNSQGIASGLEQKIAAPVSVASAKPLVLRRSPAIITVITGQEINRMGARDLTDVLMTVPGIDFGVDVTGVVGIGIRGNWANEGKVLMLIDGHEINETVYGTLQFGTGFPMDQISRIEIIRGPGSAMYGGAAEYAVINIITKQEEEGSRAEAVLSYGTTENTQSRSSGGLAIFQKREDFGFSLSSYYSNSLRSDREYTDVFANSYNMANASTIRSVNMNMGIKYRDFSIHALYLRDQYTTLDAYDEILPDRTSCNFTTFSIESKYLIRLRPNLTVTPKLSFKRNTPWETEDEYDGMYEAMDQVVYRTIADRYKVHLSSVWDPHRNLNIHLGGEAFLDQAKKPNEGDLFTKDETSKVTYHNAAIFSQGIFQNRIANLVIGARYDISNSFGSAFVPRVGLTKRIEKWNFKLLYSQSFKAPAIENVASSFEEDIHPEKTSVWEFETGWQMNRKMFVSLNIFDITTKNTIIYYVDTGTTNGIFEGYFNVDQSGSSGFEIEYKFSDDWGSINLGYAYYDNNNKAHVDVYEVPGEKREALGFGRHKLTLLSTFNLTKKWFISPSLVYKSSATAITGIDESEEYIYSRFPDKYLVNIFTGLDHFLLKNLKASLGFYNLLNERVEYFQPYSGGHAPLPGLSREVVVKLRYGF